MSERRCRTAAVSWVPMPNGPFAALLVISALAATSFYVLAAIDAGRAARGDAPILSTRALLYGAAALILLTVVVLVITGIRASRLLAG